MQPLIPPFIQQKYLEDDLRGRVEAFTLNVDLSGFTPLTETLMEQGITGAEQLSVILNDIFEPLVALVYATGGFIPYFAGDAFTAIYPLPLDRSHAVHLLHTAERARQLFEERGNRFGDQFTIGIKAGIGAGEVQYGIIGEELKAFYFRGPAIDAAAHCQTLAGDQEIVIDQFVQNLTEGGLVYTEEVDASAYRILGDITAGLQGPTISPLDLPTISTEAATAFLPPEVVRYDQAGEFRTVVSCFLSFDGVHTHEELDRFATVVLNQVRDFGGYFKEIDYGDKGAVMVIFFGAPVSYENNMARAVEFALVVQHELDTLAATAKRNFRYRMGMSVGTAFTGIVGGRERAQYACVGNRVNLAARIMAEAEWKVVLVDQEIGSSPQFRFLPKGNIRYKGIQDPEPTYVLQGRRQSLGKPTYGGEPIGRDEEVERLVQFAEPLFAQRPAGIAYVLGEAGIGKSRLTYEVRHRLNERQPINWLLGSCDQILRKPFNPFTYLLQRVFRQSMDLSAEQNLRRFQFRISRTRLTLQRRQEEAADRLAKELIRTESVLAAQLGIVKPDSLWTKLDAQGRYQNTIDAIVNLLLVEATLRPTVLELEDIHWIDEDSLAVVRELVRRIGQRPLLILATARPNDDGDYPHLIRQTLQHKLDVPVLQVEIGALSPQAVQQFAETTLGCPISKSTLETLLKATNSNPFYLEQILEYFRENKLLNQQEDGLLHLSDESIKLSTSITSILTARIDRLSDMVRETVKAAAVIGREFDVPVLTEVMRADANFTGTDNVLKVLEEQIEVAERGQIWSAMNELRYIFRHSLLREAVYGMQLTTRLQQLHRQIALAIEKIYADNIEERYVDLAFHYEQSGEVEKTLEYLSRAASYARANYQNQQALDLYHRLIKKMSQQPQEDITVQILLNQGGVYEIVGKWEEAEAAYEEAQRIAKSSRDVVLLGRTNNALGQLHTLKGDYELAMDYLKVAAGLFESVDDIFGIARAYSNMGNLFFRTNHYDRALTYYTRSLESGLSQAGTTTSAGTISHLGLTYMNLGEYEEAIRVVREQIPRHEANHDNMGLATLHTNLGIIYFESGAYDLSMDHHQQGLKLARELGDRRLQAIGLGSLGTIYERQGRYETAQELFEQDLRMCYELGDRQGIAVAEGLLGDLNSVMGNFTKAIGHLDRCLSISSELGYRKGVAKAVNTLGDIYYLQGEYEQSLQYYDQAIDIARTTNNRLVLGASLYEKGQVLLADGQLERLKETEREALAVAEDLGNPDVLFGARLLHARCLMAYDERNYEAARGIIAELLQAETITQEQEAEAYLTAYRISGKVDESAREQALQRYESLYADTPKFVYNYYLQMLRPPTAAA